MQGSLKLRHPIKVAGKEFTELTYDTEKITVEQFAQAEKEKLKTGSGGTAMAAELDYTLQLYLGMMAIIAENPVIDVADLKGVTGKDAVALYKIGRLFMLGSEGPSAESTSDDGSETTPALSAPPSPTLKKDR